MSDFNDNDKNLNENTEQENNNGIDYFTKKANSVIADMDDNTTEEEQKKNRLVTRVYNNLIDNANIPEKFRPDFIEFLPEGQTKKQFQATVNKFVSQVADFKRYLLNTEEYYNYLQKIKKSDLGGQGFYIYATGVDKKGKKRGTGTGKSELAVAILKEYAKRYAEYFVEHKGDIFDIRPLNLGRNNYLDYPYFLNSSEMFNEFRNNMAEKKVEKITEVKRRVQNATIVVWDDIGNEKQTEWVLEQLQEMISYRYDRDLPIVFTSNYRMEKFDKLNHQKESVNKQGERLYSRLKHMCEDFQTRLEGKDKRIKKYRE